MNGRTRILNENELLNRISNDAVFPVTSDTAVYNTLNVSSANYMPLINVHKFTSIEANFTSKATARVSIPEIYRHEGVILTYVYSDEENELWIAEQYNGNLFDDVSWSNDDYWKDVFGSASGSGTAGTLNTTFSTPRNISEDESFNDAIELHKVSKTGKNTDLVGFVGSRRVAFNNLDGYSSGEVFSCYGDVEIDGDSYGKNTANGLFSAAFGTDNNITNAAPFSFTTGRFNNIYGSFAFISGVDNNVYGKYNTVFGKGNSISNNNINHSFIAGESNTPYHSRSCLLGLGLISANEGNTIIGRYNKNITEKQNFGCAFVIGNGDSDSNRSNALWMLWNGYARFNNDVTCLDPVVGEARIHELSKKFDAADLINDITQNVTNIHRPVSYSALYDLYRWFIGGHDAYFYDTIDDFLRTIQNPEDAVTDEWVEYREGDQIYITNPLREYEGGLQEDIYPAFFIADIEDEWHDYEWQGDEAFVVDSNDSLEYGFYKIARLRLSHVSIVGYQKKLFDTVHIPTVHDEIFGGRKNIKTINHVSLLIEEGDDFDDDNIDVLTETTNVVESGNNLPVTSNAVYNYVNNSSITASNTKVLNTTYEESLGVIANEALIDTGDSSEIKLHKVSKTGKNVDLVDFVGKRCGDDIDVKGEIFNYYVEGSPASNVAEGAYSHVEGRFNQALSGAVYTHIEGSNNVSNDGYTHVGGKGNASNNSYQVIFGKYAQPYSGINDGRVNEEYKNYRSLFTIGWGEDASDKSNVFNISSVGHVWSKYKMTIGTLDANDVPDITTFKNNDLVTKYYVDHCGVGGGQQLYKGWLQSLAALDTRQEDTGTLYSVGNVNVTRVINNTEVTKTKHNVLTVRYNNMWLPMYDVLTFSDNPVQNDFYVIGGTYNEDTAKNIVLHKVAKTGDYRDLTNIPSVTGFPSVHLKFKPWQIDSNCNSTIGSSSVPRWNSLGGEPERTAEAITPALTKYYDSKIYLVFDCSPQWVLDNIINNNRCTYYVQLQRVSHGYWKTIRDYIPENEHASSIYRTNIQPVNLHTLIPKNRLHRDGETNMYTLVNQYEKISYELPYTVRDILMTFAQLKDSNNIECLWDVLYFGSNTHPSSTNNRNMEFAGKPSYMKGLVEVDDEIDWLNAFAASFRLGVVEYPSYTESKTFYGPSYWNNFKAMFKYDRIAETLRCSGKFTNNRIKI